MERRREYLRRGTITKAVIVLLRAKRWIKTLLAILVNGSS